MLKLLLDEHISPDVATGFRKTARAISIADLQHFEGGRLLGLNDEELLREAARLDLTLVTYDLRTIPTLLKRWAEEGRSHAGVIFANTQTIPPNNRGALIRALQKLCDLTGTNDWTDRIEFLSK